MWQRWRDIATQDLGLQFQPAAVRLLKRFIHARPDDARLRDRFKIIVNAAKLDEWNLAGTAKGILNRYNNKPLLARPEHEYFYGDDYMEICVDIYRWK